MMPWPERHAALMDSPIWASSASSWFARKDLELNIPRRFVCAPRMAARNPQPQGTLKVTNLQVNTGLGVAEETPRVKGANSSPRQMMITRRKVWLHVNSPPDHH
jgi:hypothetical protein